MDFAALLALVPIQPERLPLSTEDWWVRPLKMAALGADMSKWPTE